MSEPGPPGKKNCGVQTGSEENPSLFTGFLLLLSSLSAAQSLSCESVKTRIFAVFGLHMKAWVIIDPLTLHSPCHGSVGTHT